MSKDEAGDLITLSRLTCSVPLVHLRNLKCHPCVIIRGSDGISSSANQ